VPSHPGTPCRLEGLPLLSGPAFSAISVLGRTGRAREKGAGGMRSGAPGDRHEEAGELDEESIDESGKSCPGRSSPPGSPPLRSVGRPTRRSVGGRVSGPGDGAPKHPSLREPTQSDHAEGHGGGPNNVGMDLPLSPGSWSSARLHMPQAREPGGLGGASPPLVGGRQPREGKKPQSVRAQALVGACPDGAYPEESDAGMVPKKSAKTWVTPVESMEGRAAAKGNPIHKPTPDSGPGKWG